MLLTLVALVWIDVDGRYERPAIFLVMLDCLDALLVCFPSNNIEITLTI
jgi:hypothetical protein